MNILIELYISAIVTAFLIKQYSIGQYLILFPLNLAITFIAIIIAPILPIFSASIYGWLDNRSREGFGPRLPKWLNWFMTPDNSLDGDATFERLNAPSYWSKVKWLRRNPAYSFGIKYLYLPYESQVSGDKTIKDNDNAKAGWCFVRVNGLFQFRYIVRIPFTNRCFLCNLGWNIMGLVDDNVIPKPNPWEATFVFSPRLSGFR